jgi:hypothetical protein
MEDLFESNQVISFYFNINNVKSFVSNFLLLSENNLIKVKVMKTFTLLNYISVACKFK